MRITDTILPICDPEDAKTKLSACTASHSWIETFFLWKVLRSATLHGQAEGVDIAKVAARVSQLRKTLSDF